MPEKKKSKNKKREFSRSPGQHQPEADKVVTVNQIDAATISRTEAIPVIIAPRTATRLNSSGIWIPISSPLP
jgi:hypothetical protein